MMLTRLRTVENLATSSKLKRLLHHPIKYSTAILHRTLVYPYSKANKEVVTQTFFGMPMTLQLPAATDIYLTGGKTHPSEIRLAKFLIHHLKQGDAFLDIGAHYGYFTLLASQLVGEKGQVFSIEASPTTFDLLHKNIKDWQNIRALNIAVSDKAGTISFYEFPNLYSEYNSMELEQFKKEKWFQKYPPKKRVVDASDLSSFLKDRNYQPAIIKIDVEGAESKVMVGAKTYLEKYSPLIVMEYLSAKRGNESHRQAAELLTNLGFHTFIINQEGYLEEATNLEVYFEKSQIDSDNVVFRRT